MTEFKTLIFVVMAVTLVYSMSVKTKQKKSCCIVAVTLLLTLFSGLRSWQMGDMRHYCWAYLETNLPDWTLRFVDNGDTVGLQLFLRFFGQLGLSFEVCVFVAAAFVAITLGILVFRYSTSPFWSYVMYLSMGFFLMTTNTLKQAIAMGFVMLAMIAIIEKKPVRFVLLVAAGALFHTSALVFLAAYPFANKKIDRGYFLILIMLMVMVFFFRQEVVELFTNAYYEDEIQFEAAEFMGGKVYVMIVLLAIALILRPLNSFDTLYCQVFNINVLAVVAQTFSVYDNVFTRLAEYFFQFVILLVPLMLQPYKMQVRFHPEHREQIRYWSPKVLYVAQAALLVMTVWLYLATIDGGSVLLNEFRFVWNAEGQTSLELLAEMLAEYGG